MNNEEKDLTALSGSETLSFNQSVEKYLLSAAQWSYFLAIAGYVGCFLGVLSGIFILVSQSFLQEFSDFEQISTLFWGYYSFGISFIYFFPSYFIHRFARKAISGLKNRVQSDVNTSIKSLRNFFLFLAIMLLVLFVLFILALVSALAFFSYVGFLH